MGVEGELPAGVSNKQTVSDKEGLLRHLLLP